MAKSDRSRAFATTIAVILLLVGTALTTEAGATAAVPTTAGAGATTSATTAPAQDLPLSGPADHGIFRIYKDEEQIAKVSFDWSADGAYKGHTSVAIAGLKMEGDTTIAVGPDGRWKTVNATILGAGQTSIVRNGNSIAIAAAGRNQTVELKPRTVLFDNFSPAMSRLVLDAYVHECGDKIGGEATIPLLVLPGIQINFVVKRLEDKRVAVDGKDQIFSRYTFGPSPLCNIWTDGDHRILLLDVPQQGVSMVREGFDDLRVAAAAPPDLTVSQSKYEVTLRHNVQIPMRDGTRLATDIYLPAPSKTAAQADMPSRFPVVLSRTPYNKDGIDLQGRYYARRGYVFVAQDVRGRFDSPGTFVPFLHEKEDGYDTIEWLAKQDFADGKVGMIGGSYLGMVQWEAASLRPPHLTCIIPNVSPPDPTLNIPFEHGCVFMAGLWWLDVVESNATADLSGSSMARITANDFKAENLKSLPVIDLDKKILGHESKTWRAWMTHKTDPGYWSSGMFLSTLKDVNIPAFHQSGWFDGDGIGTKLNYLAMVHAGHPDQKLTIGPWGHSDVASRRLGDLDFGAAAMIDLPHDYLRWFDHFLKGVDNGIDRDPLVSLFVMGSNTWIKSNVYPLPETKWTHWYLHSGGGANSSAGDGTLSVDMPTTAGGVTDHYTYDPADPTPGGGSDDEDTSTTKPAKKAATGPATQPDQITRKDVLVYVTAPADKAYTFVGPVSATIFATTSARDTDWFVTLERIDAAGKVLPLGQGRMRASYRQSDTRPHPMKIDSIQEYDLDLWHTGITVMPGERLRVQIASACFPNWARNLNTGGDSERDTKYVVAHQAIYHGDRYLSCIVLPIVPTSATKPAK
jgi:uncharacterized protein